MHHSYPAKRFTNALCSHSPPFFSFCNTPKLLFLRQLLISSQTHPHLNQPLPLYDALIPLRLLPIYITSYLSVASFISTHIHSKSNHTTQYIDVSYHQTNNNLSRTKKKSLTSAYDIGIFITIIKKTEFVNTKFNNWYINNEQKQHLLIQLH